MKGFPFSILSSGSLCLGGSDIIASVKENSPMGKFISNLTITGEPGTNTIRLCLTGSNANWFYLEGRTIRLNASVSRVLDREVCCSVRGETGLYHSTPHTTPAHAPPGYSAEMNWLGCVLVSQVHGSMLLAQLTCYENDVIQVGCLSDVDDITCQTSWLKLLLFLQSHYRILVEIVNENDNRPNFQQETIEPFTVSEVKQRQHCFTLMTFFFKTFAIFNLFEV